MTRVAEYLRARGVSVDEMPHPEAGSAAAEAVALGLPPAAVTKTVVAVTEGEHALLVVPASKRMDMRRVRDAVGDPHARLATESEIDLEYPGYELGALPPIGSLLRTRMYVDPDVLSNETIVFAAGIRTTSIPMRSSDLFKDEPVTIARLTMTGDREVIG